MYDYVEKVLGMQWVTTFHFVTDSFKLFPISFPGCLSGVVAFSDCVKDDARKAVMTLKRMGMDVIMLTGDNQKTAQAIANQVNYQT